MVNDKRRTVSAPAEIGGTGLHTGASVSVRILPANDARGIRFRRTDVEGGTEIPASSEYVSDLRRRTVLGSGEAAIQTVEHLLAALSACDIDDATVEVTGPELPIGDGSTRLFFDAIREAGVLEQDTEPQTYRIESPMVVIEGESRYFLAPATQTRLTVTIEWDHPLIGRQSGCYDLSQETFDRELADARTFGFSEEAELLEEEGMAKGASPETALVLDATGLMEGDLRAPDEFVRHKTVDLIGDLKLLGGRFVGEVTAFRPSHRGNLSLVRAIQRAGRLTPPAMDISQILSVIPHRYPMLLVDRIIEVQGDERIIGIKNVTINEPFFAGHFPDHPIMPGVLIIEAMAQAGGMLLMGSVPDPESKVVYFMSIDKVKFRKPVVPGDQLRLELEMVQRRGKTCRMRGEARVADQVVAEAEMTATVVDK